MKEFFEKNQQTTKSIRGDEKILHTYTDISYGKCSKISNTLKVRTPKIIAEIIFKTS